MKLLFGTAQEGKFVPSNNKEAEEYFWSIDKKKIYGVFKRETGVRTDTQNNSLHKYFELLANELNEHGFTLKYILGIKQVELDWTPELIKENVWRPIQIALTKKKSTTKLDKVSDINIVYEHLNRFFSGKPFFLHIPFPNDPNKK